MGDIDKKIEGALENDEKKDKKNNKDQFHTFNYEKKQVYGTIDISKNWKIQVTKTSWKGRKPKYEIRKWKKDGTPSKGVTFTKEQFKKMIEIVKKMDI